MCGLAGYAGKGEALPFIEHAIARLEYRGYDSHGYLLARGGRALRHVRRLGGMNNHIATHIESDGSDDPGNIGIGHTRWATNGGVSIPNVHPVVGRRIKSSSGSEEWPLPFLYLAHNGKVDNADRIRGVYDGWFCLDGETDSEVVACYLAEFLRQATTENDEHIAGQVIRWLACLAGNNAFVVWLKGLDLLIAVARGLPLVVSPDGHVASDASVLAGHSERFYRIPDGRAVILRPDGRIREYDLAAGCVQSRVPPFDLPVPTCVPVHVRRHTHAMREEIDEQRSVLTWSGQFAGPLRGDRLCLFGCGSSYHAALVGRGYFQSIAAVPTTVEYATEMFDLPLLDGDRTEFVALTQSGETRDVLLGIERVRLTGKQPMVVTTNPYSSAASMGECLPLLCGEERGVAATKTFAAQLVRLLEMAAVLSERDPSETRLLVESLSGETGLVSQVIEQESLIGMVAQEAVRYRSHLFLGRGNLLPIAMEGALKMKEVAYIHAEAIHASELKHGPLALVDDDTLSIVLLAHDNAYVSERVVGNIREILARKGKVVVFTDDRSYRDIRRLPVQSVVRVPTCHQHLQPVVMAVAVQLLAYHCAVLRGLNVDRPRSIAKCVTVE